MRRLGALLVALVLVAGCRADDDGGASPPPPGESVTSYVTGPQADPSDGGGPRQTIVVGGEDAVPGDAVTTVPEQPVASGAVGSAAPRYLQPAGSARIVVQVITQSGAAPRAATVDHLVALLSAASGKPVSTAGGAVEGDRERWTGADMRNAAINAAFDAPEGTAVLRLLFVRGRFDEGRDNDDQIMGLSIASDLAVIFSDKVDEASSPLVSAAHIEDAVTTHELGHLLGLVDLYLRTGRQDPDHPGHSRNRNSVMYWAVESSLVTDLLSGGPPREFDADDKADLATIRNA